MSDGVGKRWWSWVAAAWIASAPIAPILAGSGGAGVAVDATVRPYARIVAKSGPEGPRPWPVRLSVSPRDRRL